MECYIGTKIVLAEPMDKATAVMNGLVRDAEVTIEPDGSSEPGYAVVYEGGYRSWSPKQTFQRAYRRITDAEAELVLQVAGEPCEIVTPTGRTSVTRTTG